MLQKLLEPAAKTLVSERASGHFHIGSECFVSRTLAEAAVARRCATGDIATFPLRDPVASKASPSRLAHHGRERSHNEGNRKSGLTPTAMRIYYLPQSAAAMAQRPLEYGSGALVKADILRWMRLTGDWLCL